VCGTGNMVNIGLVGMQIVTALLLRFSLSL
jgi:hypothetical protein